MIDFLSAQTSKVNKDPRLTGCFLQHSLQNLESVVCEIPRRLAVSEILKPVYIVPKKTFDFFAAYMCVVYVFTCWIPLSVQSA